ncbi:hypothetical protein ACQEVB_09345 [Pseudonocardia sp. CA-107938]|uniref:hypothetical protein n=1 Tax=Pseudonocardia sp. CA-107938 TaxID=3240021 RepID=UPI003D920B91
MNGRHLLPAVAMAVLCGCTAPPPPAPPPVAVLAPAAARQQLTNGSATCDFDVTWLTVSGIDEGAAATANAALDLTPEPADCAETTTINGGYRGQALNERGVLSVAYLVTRSVPGGAYPNQTLQTFVIDLRTGQEIPLDDVLTPAGRAAFVDACGKGLDPRLDPNDLCRTTYDTGPDAPYTVTRDGLVAQPYNEVPHAAQALAEQGVLVPWAALGDGLRPGTPIAALAGR